MFIKVCNHTKERGLHKTMFVLYIYILYILKYCYIYLLYKQELFFTWHTKARILIGD